MLRRSNTHLLVAVMSVFPAVASLTTASAREPATQPSSAAAAPASAPAPAVQIDADAKPLLDAVSAAYLKLPSATIEGSISAEMDIAGQVQNDKKPFTASFLADGVRFRHETSGEVLIGSSGDNLFAYRVAAKGYLQEAAPGKRVLGAALPQPYQMIIRTQDLFLLLAISSDPAAELTTGATSVKLAPDVAIDGKPYSALAITSADSTTATLAIDPDTKLLRRVTFDMAGVAKSRGAPDVKKAILVNDFAKVTTGPDLTVATFAWAPPADAQDESTPKGGEQMADASAALTDKPAPAFKLTDDTGAEFNLSAQKGNVVILDFWATWCPPCREGLPVLDALSKEFANKNVRVVGVNVREQLDEIAAFKAKTKLGLNVVLDAEGKVSEQYKVTGIPQTVIIDKAGIVRKVIVGYNPEEKAEIKKLLEELSK